MKEAHLLIGAAYIVNVFIDLRFLVYRYMKYKMKYFSPTHLLSNYSDYSETFTATAQTLRLANCHCLQWNVSYAEWVYKYHMYNLSKYAFTCVLKWAITQNTVYDCHSIQNITNHNELLILY